MEEGGRIMTTEIIRMVIEAILGGTILVTLVTLKSSRKKAMEEARRATIDNDKELMINFHKFIVEPLKKEVYDLRSYVRMFTKAIAKINDCPNSNACPVRCELQNTKRDDGRTDDPKDK